jgi:hypothetical protein
VSGSASGTSMHSLAGTMNRVNTVTSLLKRFLSKDDNKGDSRPGSAANSGAEKGLGTSASSASMAGKQYPAQIGSMKITDQVIEEVDEQMTITSMRNKDDPRPTAQSLFPPPSAAPSGSSAPIDVPGTVNHPHHYGRFYSAQVHEDDNAMFPPDDVLSSSVPIGKPFASSSHQPNLLADFDPKPLETQESQKDEDNIEEADSVKPDDEFERLRQQREADRLARQKEKIARSISAQQGE